MLQKEKNLVLFFSNDEEEDLVLAELNKSEEIVARCVLKPVNKLLRIIRRVHFKSKLPGIGIWLRDWKKEIQEEQLVICIASDYSDRVLKWIKKKFPTTRLINYYWDEIEISKYPIIKCGQYENWSFCKRNCDTYGMQYNPQFYVSTMKLPDVELKYDVVFIGSDRNGTWNSRGKLVEKCYQIMNKLDIKNFFWYVGNQEEVSPEIRKKDLLSHMEYNNITAESRAILEIIEPGKEWITLRPLLGLSNRKKIITNNVRIMEEMYYSKENIFILGKDDECDLKQFLNSPFDESVKEKLKYYDAKQWIKRFGE